MSPEHHIPPFPIDGLNLSPAQAALLLYGSTGKAHRLRMATLGLESLARGQAASPPSWTADFLLGAFESDPADTALAAQVLRIGLKLGALAPELRVHVEAAATGRTTPVLGHWREGMDAWRDGQMMEALKHFNLCGGLFATPVEYMGHCLVALGEQKAAQDLWRQILRRRPWHTQLYLTLHDHALGMHHPLPGIGSPTAALFYSWNKADDLHAALASLEGNSGTLPEDLALVACLDNGSTDATADVLRHWQTRWGQRFLPVRLPVNVGAAAARNWLASLPQVQALPYAVYIDDDALLPPHWLGHLGQAMQAYPDAAVWGCRIVDAHDPANTQCGPLHMQPLFCAEDASGPPLPGQPDIPGKDTSPDVAFSPLLAAGQPFRLTHHLCAGQDYGAYNYMRPCAAVAGCCHLFRTKDLAEQGFSINFSPSQHDDAERDLRMLQQGRMACYTGFCAVRHRKRTGAGTGASGVATGNAGGGEQPLSGAAYGNAVGNLYKLHGLFDAETVAACVRREHAALHGDFCQRLARLEQCGVLC